MRVALLASTFALLVAQPALAQCVYVACNGGAQAAPVYQQPAYQPPVYQAPSQAPRAAPGYDDGYAAGLAARPSAGHQTKTHQHTTRRAATARPTKRSTNRLTSAQIGSGRSTAGTGRATHGAAVVSSVRRHASAVQTNVSRRATTVRRAPLRVSQIRRATNAQHVTHQRLHTSTHGGIYHDPIKDRAATYRPSVYGQSTNMASMMSRSSSYSSTTTTWSGPATVVNQGGQVCGWGARIVTNNHGFAQRHATWVCQCPQGWRPPGY